MATGEGESPFFSCAVTLPEQAESHCLTHSKGEFWPGLTEGVRVVFQQDCTAVSQE